MMFPRWIVAAGLLLAAATAQAGTIDPELQAQIDRTAPNTPISVIVNLAEQAPLAQMNQDLDQRNATRQERHRVVVTALQDVATRSQGPLKAYLEERMRAGDVLGYTSYWISNLIIVQATAAAIERIAARPDVDVVEPNFHAELIQPVEMHKPGGTEGTRQIGVPPGIRAIRAPQCWYQLGITGAGTIIGGMDTGVKGDHVALNTRWRGYNGQHPWQQCWLDVLGTNTDFPSDTYGHGTHTMGTMTGQAPTDSIGVAPGAQWISCNAINQGVGNEFDNDVIHGFQWFADPDGDPTTVDDVPDVVQNSWGVNSSFPGYHACDMRWWSVLDGCSAAGIIVTWSAGNEGPGAQTMRSPADRATTLTEAFSVGAVDASNYPNFPYPIADFSSRGPTTCVVPPPNQIKPEVVAPGVNVYSSYNDGGYTYLSGTSMAGPHVAGTAALMRQANPNISVDQAKSILMATAHDEGPTGEDNTYGWGFIDAYAAVQAATVGFGTLQGHVTDASFNSVPVPGASVRVMTFNRSFGSDANGFYHGLVAPGTYTVVATCSGFAPDSGSVTITGPGTFTLDFPLADNAGPAITNVTNDITTNDTADPTPIAATITDVSTVASAALYYRVNGGDWSTLPMTPAGNVYSASIPAMPLGMQVDYYVSAADGVNNASTSPANAPSAFYTLYVTQQYYAYDMEDSHLDTRWVIGAHGDHATKGIWIRDVPVGSVWDGLPCQPDSDHTPAPGVKCFVTGNAPPNAPPNQNSVTNGCTTLMSPLFNLSGNQKAFVSYWRWYSDMGLTSDDTWQVDASSDGGLTWTPFERLATTENQWTKYTGDLGQVITLTGLCRLRFVACDTGNPSIVEAAIDDIDIETFTERTAGAGEAAAVPLKTSLEQSQPNPAGPLAVIHFNLSNAGHARIDVFDASGRRVRTLVDAQLPAGAHDVTWNMQDDQGRPVGSGVYFYDLKAGATEQGRRMTILK